MTRSFARLRRLREQPVLREMLRETHLGLEQLIMPLFVHHGTGIQREIPSMPGQYQWSIDRLLPECRRLTELGVRAVILFGLPATKDDAGSGAYAPDGIVQQAMRAIREAGIPLLLVGDVCLCEYTSHGHCGIVAGERIDNDATLPLLARTAVSQARAGADIIAPSDMMDGRIAVIREALDAEGFSHIPIMSYAAKYASAFYGPFREAAHSAPTFGDRRSHQMDPPNGDEALREALADVEEGADILMVKPALAYLDVIWRVKCETGKPVAAYAVSGEFAMIEAAARNGWVDRNRIVYESLIGMRRAGADLILTYHTPLVAELMRNGGWPPV